VDVQIAAHQTALNGLRNYSANGGVTALKDFATQLIPTVTAHLNSAKALKH
jgi:putative membrane protein